MIDTLKNIPVVKSYVEIFNILTYGYKDLGKVDFGPYIYTYAFNSPNKPYIELGYGIENIFRFIRVDAFHRITYLKNPEASKYGVKIYFQLIL
jgi:hypothetical protein